MIWDLAEGRVDGHALIAATPLDFAKNFQSHSHGLWEVQHCLDYLRQGIQCAGDLALEWPVEADGKLLYVGWDTPHECSRADVVEEFVEKHAAERLQR